MNSATLPPFPAKFGLSLRFDLLGFAALAHASSICFFRPSTKRRFGEFAGFLVDASSSWVKRANRALTASSSASQRQLPFQDKQP
jgi:hypothetical protein